MLTADVHTVASPPPFECLAKDALANRPMRSKDFVIVEYDVEP